MYVRINFRIKKLQIELFLVSKIDFPKKKMPNIKFRVEIYFRHLRNTSNASKLKTKHPILVYVFGFGFVNNKHVFMAINRDFTRRFKLEAEHT